MRLPDLRDRRVNTAALAVVLVVGLAGAALVGVGLTGRDDERVVAVQGPVAVTASPTPPGVSASAAPRAPQSTSPSPARRPDGVARVPLLPLPDAVAGERVAGGGRLVDVKQDQGMSVPLRDGRNLWIFADTTQQGYDPNFFVTSSAGVAARGSQKLRYLSTGVKPVEFLKRTAAERATQVNGVSYTAVWPTGATALPDGRALISYAKYDVTLNPPTYTLRGAGLYTYRYPGYGKVRGGGHANRLAEVWAPGAGAVGSPLYHDGFVYFTQCESLQCYAARTTVGGLASASSYRWSTGSGWGSRAQRKAMSYAAGKPGLNPSVTYLPSADVFATVSTSAGHTARTGQLWVSPNPWGPWSRPKNYALPDCPAAGCYTLNLHPSESGRARVRVSYATAGIGPYVHVTDVPVRVTRSATRATVS